MFDYLQQFNKLPKELRERVSSPAAMDILSSLEKKYGLSLAMLVMQIMIKQVLIKDLPAYLISEMGLAPDKAQSLASELRERLFFSVASYLGMQASAPLSPEEKELQILMKDNGVVLPSQDLMNRCRQILLTYRKGVRTKIDARAALERPVMQGGLGLDVSAADRLLRALDKPTTGNAAALPAVPAALADLINKNEASAYDLKTAIAQGAVKAPAALASRFKPAAPKLDLEHELEAPEKELALAAPAEVKTLAVPKPAPSNSLIKDSAPKKEIKKAAAPHDLPLLEEAPLVQKISAPIAGQEAVIAPALKPEMASPLVNIAASVNDKVPVEDKAAVKNRAEDKAAVKDPDAIAPETAVRTNAFAPVHKPNLWSGLFKGGNKKDAADKISASGNHLAAAVEEAAKAAAVPVRPAASTETKTKMDDVKARPKVMGPLEELRYLDLTNFRRLGASPKEITEKLVMKIKLLEKDGYDRMVEGVKSWRQSPVNRIYVRLAQEAVAQGVTLRDAVAARQAENKETLTMEEIEAIVAMNSRLMF